MKQRLGIAFLALLLCGAVGLAKTNYFDNIYVDGTATIVGGMTFSGAVSIDDTTAASSTVTGSLHTDGGVGIAKNLYIGTDISMVGLTGVHDLFLTDAVVDALSIQRGTTDFVVFDTSTVSVDITGDLDANGALMVLDGSTSFRGISAAFTSLESPANRFGVSSTIYTQFATTAVSGVTAVTMTGSAPTLTWTANSFDFVGAIALDATTLSDVLTFSDGGTIDNSDATTLQLTETNIDLVGATAADALTLSDALTFSDSATIDNTAADTLTITETNIDLVGAAILDGVTISGDVDSAGLCDFQFNPVTGASNGHILKSTFTTATVYSGTSAGLIVKSYFADTGTTITGGEFTGVYINVKQLAAMAGGAKSSIISGHNYGSGGDYQSLDYGSILYGDLTWGYVLSGGTSTYGLYFGDQTISTADIYLQNGATIGEAVDGVLQIDSTTAIEVDGNLYVEDATNSGAMFVSQFSITYAQTASYTTCVIPANADVLKVEVVTTTAFSGGSATTIDVGYVGTLEAYASDLDIRSAGFADCDVFSNLGDVGVSDVTMKAQITTDDSAGACTVYFYWTMGTPGTP